jgi:choline dehydrogenase-like flavoprotein
VVDGFVVETSDGHRAVVRGREYVLACGAVSSSALLLAADGARELLQRERLPVGERFSANLASPAFGFAPEPVHRATSLQMTHVLVPEDAASGWLLETWFSPPGGLALAMPGYMNRHHERMLRYASTLCAAPVVGSRPSGRVRVRKGRPDVQLPLSGWEADELRQGTLRAVESLLRAGATEAVVRFGAGRVVRDDAGLAALDAEMRMVGEHQPHLLPLSTAHPQGGNALSADPAIGVVGGDFRVRGTRNLRICDGSVFPDCARVNPQWTIMALAHLCAHAILSD